METIQKTKNILIPFVGFYETSASDRVENIAFYNFISERGIQEDENHKRLDIPDDLTEKEQEDFWGYYSDNCKALQKETAIAYMDALGGELGLDLKFESINSPKYYNYTTDRLFVDALESELFELYHRTDKVILAEMIKDRHTSQPGFDSFYPEYVGTQEWQCVVNYDHNQWETVILANVKQNGVDLSELYYI